MPIPETLSERRYMDLLFNILFMIISIRFIIILIIFIYFNYRY